MKTTTTTTVASLSFGGDAFFFNMIVDSQAFPRYKYDEEVTNIIVIVLIHRNLVHTQEHMW